MPGHFAPFYISHDALDGDKAVQEEARNVALAVVQAEAGPADAIFMKETDMTEKSASVLWNGAGKNGQGQVSTESGALMDYPYGFASRFGDDPHGTNPEEILAAAHAACFTMAFSFACEKAGFATTTADTQAHVRLSAQGEGFVIDRITLRLKAVVPGLDEAGFQAIAQAAKINCPLSRALASVPEISLLATLERVTA